MSITNLQLLAKHLRHRLRRALVRPPAGTPILFANSFPKSGTHLLTQALHGLTRLGPAVDSGLPAIVMYDGPTGAARPLPAILADLARLRPGDIAYGHLHAAPGITAALCRDGAAPFFIYRDPRDAAVSHVHYVTDIETDHAHHAYYKALPDFHARLRASILGRPELGGLFPDIRARFEPYLGWLDRPEVCALRFEDFIRDQEATLGLILTHAASRGFPVPDSAARGARTLMAGIIPEKSPTFRSGKIGGWRENFSEENKRLFKETAGDLLVRLGYEDGGDW